MDRAAALAQRLSLLERHQAREVFTALEDERVPALQDPRAIRRGAPTPCRQRPMRRIGRRARVLGAAVRNLGERARARGIVHGEATPRPALNPASLDADAAADDVWGDG